jgi:hypothetical protein
MLERNPALFVLYLINFLKNPAFRIGFTKPK